MNPICSCLSESEHEGDGDTSASRKRKSSEGRGISPIEWDREESDAEERSDNEDGSEHGSGDDDEVKDRKKKIKYLFKNARYYLIKSNNHENVALAKAKGVWSTPPQNEARLNQAYKECDNVILIFSVKESGKFQGYARLAAESTKDHPPIRWVLPVGLNARALSGVFKLDWISRMELPFTKTTHLHNPWNENKPVKIGRDGQEIEPRCGEALCKLFPSDDNVDLNEIVREARRSKRPEYRFSSRGRESFRGRGDFRPRRRPYERFDGPTRAKRGRPDFGRDRGNEGFYKDRRMDRGSPRYNGGVRRETFISGSYNDYMREFVHRAPPPPMPPFGQMPQPYMDQSMAHYTGYERPREYNMAIPEYSTSHSQSPSSHSRSRSEKRSGSRGEGGYEMSGRYSSTGNYDRDVEDFLRRTTGSSRSREHRDRSRERDRDREREREREMRERERHHHSSRSSRSEREGRR